MISKESAYNIIQSLVEKFHEQLPNYKRADYNETLTRRDFIDPFFEALGWDINNRAGLWESYREVIHEHRIKIGGLSKAPDYCFRLGGGNPLFFVEAKKPNVVIKDDAGPAYQVRRYGWNAKLNISIVTDFEEFAVYDCTKKPSPLDKPSKNRLKYITYANYLDEFDFIWDTFSKEKVLKGGLVKFQQAEKKGTATVDREFLISLDEWRILLATNIAKNNPGITEDELNYAVQQTIDRLLFLRIAEDRGLEPHGKLKGCLGYDDHYKELFRLFNEADLKYNSGLFHFHKEKENRSPEDKLTGSITIDNKTIKTIVKSFYDNDYLFNVIPVEILGSAYEQFLGKQIYLKGAKAAIDQKTEVRKAGGVYYTPQYIVEYIVKNTVGKLVKGKTLKEVSKLKIVDPACGSGSFLLGAYEFLINWHVEQYTKANIDPNKKNSPILPDGNLSTDEKKRILLNNIYGVDIDANAVEVTKLSLLLKCMEGETQASMSKQINIMHARILPSLEGNIKSGNSLVGLDYYDGELDFGDEKKIKPFSWEKNFPEVFKQGGFDAVIGNPPYVKEYTSRETFDPIKRTKLSEYYQGKMDLWYIFASYGIDLLKKAGKLGFIVPNNWVTNAGASILRNKIINDSQIENVVDFNDFMVFQNASIQTMILIVQKSETKPSYNFKLQKFHPKKHSVNEVIDELNNGGGRNSMIVNYEVERKKFINKFINFGNASVDAVLDKIVSKKNFELDERREVAQGIVPNPDILSKKALSLIPLARVEKFHLSAGHPVFVVPKNYFRTLNKSEETFLKPLFEPSDIQRYHVPRIHKKEIIYLTKQNEVKGIESLIEHLTRYKEVMNERRETQQGKLKYYHLHWPRDNRFFIEGPKILCVRKCIEPTFAFTTQAAYVMMAMNIIVSERINLKYLTAILNSEVVKFWLKNKGKMQGSIYQVDKEPLIEIPICVTSNEKKSSELEKLVDDIIVLKSELLQTTASSRYEAIQHRISHTDDKINRLVYELYGLTEDEIKIVEGNN